MNLLTHSLYKWIGAAAVLAGTCIMANQAMAQHTPDAVRTMHYLPDGDNFTAVNGHMRFNRALYGTNTAFRVEAGDLPEFALYLPGMGGNLRLGLQRADSSKWLINARNIKAIYRPGSMLYEIRDGMLGKGILNITILPLSEGEGMILRITAQDIPANATLCWAYGGVTGKKFSRDGDIGADPESSFYLQPEYCKGNLIAIQQNRFQLSFAKDKKIEGVFPKDSRLQLADAATQTSPAALLASAVSATPVLAGALQLRSKATNYFLVAIPGTGITNDAALEMTFEKAEKSRQLLAQRVLVTTPDKYINTLGSALAMAADGIWESPTFLHGAVAWRMRLNAWRGAYVADPLGWHDRARTHFNSYSLSQVTSPETGPVVADTALHLARQLEKMGTSLFSSGYICRNPNGDIRPHHYDMNLVFIDQLIRHFSWTGDTAYLKQMWPVLQRHLAWEKRNFDTDNDGLYDAYCCIWASDGLQYSGGGVTHSSAYNYFANRMVAELAPLIGENGAPYAQEADKIYKAVQSKLWLSGDGWYAEYKDALGQQQVHPAAAIWSIYHAIDSRVPDLFQSYQSLRYVDTRIPHIPVKAVGLPDSAYYLLATTNWQPYTWSLNNVALAENLHMSLAYWQGNRADEAFWLWKSSLVESMYMSASPGGFEQLSYYDAVRGELYRDFADPIGMAGRTLVEGLFGIVPDALHDTLAIHPGFPAAWDHASLRVPDIAFSYHRKEQTDIYSIIPAFRKKLHLKLELAARNAGVESVMVNGKAVAWTQLARVGQPAIVVAIPAAARYTIAVTWKKGTLELPAYAKEQATGQQAEWRMQQADIVQVYDPQQVLGNIHTAQKTMQATIQGSQGAHTFFLLLQQGAMQWWQPIDIIIQDRVSMQAATEQPKDQLRFALINHSAKPIQGTVTINAGSNQYAMPVELPAGPQPVAIAVSGNYLVAGTNRIHFNAAGYSMDTTLINWDVTARERAIPITMNTAFNDQLTHIFTNQYLSPRPQSPTLQLPTQGIGNWCYPLVQAVIDDSGLRAAAHNDSFTLPQGIAFATPADSTQKNILFTSQWDNYPAKADIVLTGKARHAYFLMAGSTNAMQTQVLNGRVTVQYTDGTHAVLELRNPDTWCPIEQDYDENGYAFHLERPRPPRVYLKTGEVHTTLPKYATIKGYSNRAITGGAATVLDMPLDETKELKSLTLQTVANDVVIGLMAVSLVR